MYSYRIINNIPSVNESKFLIGGLNKLQTITVTSDNITIGGFTGTALRLYTDDDEVAVETSVKDVTITNNRPTKVSIYRGSETDYLMPHLITLFPNTKFTIKNVRIPVKWTIFECEGDAELGDACPELHFVNHTFTLIPPTEELTKCSTCGTYVQVIKCNNCVEEPFQMCLRCYYSVKFGTEQSSAEHFKMCYVPAEQWWGTNNSGMEDTAQNKVVQIIIAKYSEIKRKEAAAAANTEPEVQKEEEISSGRESLRSTHAGKEKDFQKADIDLESSGSQEEQ